jgi:hypothetical protein
MERRRRAIRTLAAFALAVLSAAPGSATEGGPQCEGTAGWYSCRPGQVCDLENETCVEKAVPKAGEKLCEDGLTTCPQDRDCNVEGFGRFKCLAPGSTRCPSAMDFPMPGRRGGSTSVWCGPGEACDVENSKCVEKAVPKAGEKLCDDGLTVCPADRECNLEGTGNDRCLVSGSARCATPTGLVFWCAPPTTCDLEQARCTKAAVLPPPPEPGAAGAEARITGTWSIICGARNEPHSGTFYFDVIPDPYGKKLAGRIDGDTGSYAAKGVFSLKMPGFNLRLESDYVAGKDSIEFTGNLTGAVGSYEVSGDVSGRLVQGGDRPKQSCNGKFSGR